MMTFTEWTAQKPSKEMEDWFEKRTKRHIGLVQKYCKKIAEYDPKRFGELAERCEKHDQSKLEEPEHTPYVFITWQYKCKDAGEKFDPPAGLAEKMSRATEHHVKHNRHHPEFHSAVEVDFINREDRDKPPAKMVDATKMPDLDVAEMVADWCGMSEEKGGKPRAWADKNVNIRWKFTEDQVKLIHELIEAVWE